MSASTLWKWREKPRRRCVAAHVMGDIKRAHTIIPTFAMHLSLYHCICRMCARARARARVCVCVCVCVCVVSVIVKRPVLPPCAVDGRSRNPLYYYYIPQSSQIEKATTPPPRTTNQCNWLLQGAVYLLNGTWYSLRCFQPGESFFLLSSHGCKVRHQSGSLQHNFTFFSTARELIHTQKTSPKHVSGALINSLICWFNTTFLLLSVTALCFFPITSPSESYFLNIASFQRFLTACVYRSVVCTCKRQDSQDHNKMKGDYRDSVLKNPAFRSRKLKISNLDLGCSQKDNNAEIFPTGQ